MNIAEIKRMRLANQQLVGTMHCTPKEIVNYFGAIQAQDYAMAKWAIGVRLGVSEQKVEDAINNAEIIRTHILRPTWHFVAANDIRWMLELTGPHVKKLTTSMCKKYGFDEKSLSRFYILIEKLLAGNKQLTREEIMLELKIKTMKNDIRPTLIMMSAELEGIVCNGIMREKKITYALLDERIPKSKKITKEEALAELAKKYFSSHGLATLQDFAWWSGLSSADSKTAFELIKPNFESVKINQQEYIFNNQISHKKNNADCIHLLPAFDEFLISYKDRTASISLENQSKAFTKNGIFNPIIVVNGEVIGTWKRTIKNDIVVVELKLFNPFFDNQKIISAANLYGNYLDKKIKILS